MNNNPILSVTLRTKAAETIRRSIDETFINKNQYLNKQKRIVHTNDYDNVMRIK